MVIFAGILAVGLLTMLIYLLSSALKDGWYLLMHQLGFQKAFMKASDIERITGYLQNFTYYLNLSEEGKKKFVNRLLTFMFNKEFTGGTGLVVTEEMQVLISASAIQLTFGMHTYKLQTLETITIFPDTFYLTKRGPEYKGATQSHNMFLSWKDFQDGYAKTDDNLNLGLHEMTHALKLTLAIGERFDSLFADRMDYWENMVNKRFTEPVAQRSSFLRSYSNANPAEFFSVCVEAFFESPVQFKKELPEIFQLLVFLLNQDPLNKLNDYVVAENYFDNNAYNIPSPKEVKRSYKYSTNHWSTYVLAVGLIGALPTILYMFHHLMFPYFGFLLIVFVIGSIGLLQRRYFEERSILSGQYFIMYSYGGFGGAVTSLLLWINLLLPVSGMHSQKEVIKDYYAEYNHTKYGGRTFVGWRVELEDELQFNGQLLTLGSKPEGQQYIVFDYKYGILGIKEFEDYYYTNGE